MLYETATDWNDAAQKRVMLFGMSGLGKTHLSNILRAQGDWFHYSVDYRIGTRYMGEHIVDNFKREAMRNPFLADLLRSDSLFIGSNITFNNLSPLSTYMGKPGNPALGGIGFTEYQRRQGLHREAEIAALLDTPLFITRAHELYGYDHFVCDSGGSICEVIDPANPNDPILSRLASNLLLVWIRGDDAHIGELTKRFETAPKPMYFDPAALPGLWRDYCRENNVNEADVDPDAFMRFAYRRCLDHRLPLYRSMAENWGVSIAATEVARIGTAAEFDALIAAALAGS